MRYEFIYYSTDESFDYGDFPNSTYHCTGLHGFSIEITKDDIPLLDTIDGFGDFADVKDHAQNYKDFADYLKNSLGDIQREDENASSIECFEELIDFVESQMRQVA